MRLDTVLHLSALQQAALIRDRLVSSEELTRAYLDRIERWNPILHAFVEVHAHRALHAARRKDRETRRHAGSLPPFHGVPTAIKDLNFVRGMWTRLGSRGFCVFSPADDLLAKQVRAAGFVILGKTATSELGTVSVTEPDIHPPTRNPWCLDRNAGGSSGGAASAVSGALLPIAPGSDGAGSIRIPSSFCHLVGLKPSRGRVANAFNLPDRNIIYTDGPIGRTVADVAAMLDALSGLSVGSPHWAPKPEAPFSQLLELGRRRLRIHVVTTHVLGAVDPEAADAAMRAASSLESLGHHVEHVSPPAGTLEEFLPIWAWLTAQSPPVDLASLQPVTRWLVERGRLVSAEDAERARQRLASQLLGWFGEADVVISPTTPAAAPLVGEFEGLAAQEQFERVARFGWFTAVFNLTGQPAITVPAAVSASGLPLGVQIAGRPFDEALVLAVARQLEQAMPWSLRRPKLLAGAA